MLHFEQDIQTKWNKGRQNHQIYSYRIKKLDSKISKTMINMSKFQK